MGDIEKATAYDDLGESAIASVEKQITQENRNEILYRTWKQIIAEEACGGTEWRNRKQIYAHIQGNSAFSDENSSVYISALTNDIQSIEQGYLWNTFSMLDSLLTFAGAMALMIWYSPLLTLIAIGLSFLPLIASILTGSKAAQAEKNKSQVLLVDEATASLDAETAYQVSSAILGLDGITRIVVTHSLDAGLLRQYDGILTFRNGSVVEKGTFDELIAQKGYFYSLFTISQ